MTDLTTETSLNNYARVAGFAYLAIIITSILNLIFVETKLVVDGNAAATTDNILANALLFRVGLAVDLVMFAGVVLLSLTLYLILKTVDNNLALLALLWRATEAVIGLFAVLAGMFVVLLLDGDNFFTVFKAEQVQALVHLFLQARAIGFDIAIFFLSLGTIVFCYLLLKSRYIPRNLAIFGLISFPVMLLGSLVNILSSGYAEIVMVSYVPGILFEVVVGAWLLFKGLNLQRSDNRDPASPSIQPMPKGARGA